MKGDVLRAFCSLTLHVTEGCEKHTAAVACHGLGERTHRLAIIRGVVVNVRDLATATGVLELSALLDDHLAHRRPSKES